MTEALNQMRPVYVIGVGLHRYQYLSDTTYVTLGLTAVREALKDARISWPSVESAYTGTALLGMAASRPMLRHLGATGIPMAQVENASASGSTAFRQACLDVACGMTDISLAVGVDKPGGGAGRAGGKTGMRTLAGTRVVPFTHFALLANEYMNRYGVTAEQVAAVAVKNRRNGSNNPYAQHQRAVTLDEVMAGPPISGTLTRMQCTPVGEGAAVAIVASGDAIARFGIDRSRAVRVIASVSRSERVYSGAKNHDAELTRETVAQAYQEVGVGPADLDVIELHDAFAIEELLYAEAMGLCGEGEAAALIASGATDIGGKCAVSASGGLLAMGHPIGPTGVGQIAEITRQLRGEAGVRQQPNARIGLAHMVGVGAVCLVHILQSAA
ncbi:MAG: thiolase family protein [Candidatus Binataceae bacterium]